MLYVWSWFIRISHWMLVAAFTTAFVYSDSMWEMQTHVMAGYAVGALLLTRIFWGLFVKGYGNFAKFPFKPLQGFRYAIASLTGHARRFIGHNPAGSVVIYAMLSVGTSTVTSGLLVLNNAYLPVSNDILASIHAFMSWSWLALICMHIGGVVVESVLQRENLIATMITGFKHRHVGDKRYLNHKHELNSDHG